MRVCIYTAAFGGYDALKAAVPQSVPTDFFCFTDGQGISGAKPWIIRHSAARKNLSPRMRAKWFKLHPHVLFPGGALPLSTAWQTAFFRWRQRYTHTIWIDASLEVVSPYFAEAVIAQLGQSGLAVFPHPDRDCIFDEAVASTHWAKYEGQPLLEQAQAYRAEGYPAHHGLFAAGILVRSTSAAHLPALDDAWWQENLRWSYQDQLSLPVVWWRAGRRFDVIDANLWTNPWFRYHKHPREEGLLPAYR
jgi:hypothetical protein